MGRRRCSRSSPGCIEVLSARAGFLVRSLSVAVAVTLCGAAALAAGPSAWPVVGGDSGSTRYSPLADIHRGNVTELEVVWVHQHGDFHEPPAWLPSADDFGTAFEATPLLVEGKLVYSTPYNRVIALDPETGTEIWSYDPGITSFRRYSNMMISRGVSFWRDPSATGKCASRILLATLDARLIALDTQSGSPCDDFGSGGTVNLLEGIEPLVDPAEYNVTSPPTVIGDLAVVGSAITDNLRPVAPSGAVRAYDVRTGAMRWRFDTIPSDGEIGSDTWEGDSSRHSGAANVWSIATADPERGLVFLPVSTASPDYFGGSRLGANLFSDSVVALDAATGEYRWHFQTVHHDLWDYDVASPPVLVRVTHDGIEVDAVALPTKMGFVFLLDRDSGVPLFPVEERAVPKSDVPGEVSWPTQPFPLRPPPLVPQRMTEADLWAPDPERLAACRKLFRSLRNEGIYTPPSQGGSILYPGTGGGANWSGGAFDPTSGLLFVPANNFAHTVALEALDPSGFDKSDAAPMSSLLDGLLYLLTGKGTGLRYGTAKGDFVLEGLPCNKPPWGTLSAVDLERGELRWQVPIGEVEGMRGSWNFGPPLATGGGLVFLGGSIDSRFRAYDAATGEVLATFEMPAGVHAGPMTYKLRPNGRQYLVVAAGGHYKLGSKHGDHLVAFALSEEKVAGVDP